MSRRKRKRERKRARKRVVAAALAMLASWERAEWGSHHSKITSVLARAADLKKLELGS